MSDLLVFLIALNYLTIKFTKNYKVDLDKTLIFFKLFIVVEFYNQRPALGANRLLSVVVLLVPCGSESC